MAELGEILPAELKRRIDRGDKLSILDVREPEEVGMARFPGAIHVPMADIPARLADLDRDAEWVIVCHHGIRSAQAAAWLAHVGFQRVLNLIGGIDGWSIDVDASTPRY